MKVADRQSDSIGVLGGGTNAHNEAVMALLRTIAENGSKSNAVVERLADYLAAPARENAGAQQGRDARGYYKLEPDGVSPILVNTDIGLGDLAKTILRLMQPLDIVDRNYIRVGNEYDGGYVMIDHGLENTVAYSFGINDDVSWDQGMVDRGCHIFQFDHTIDNLPYEHKQFHWQKLGIAAETSGEFISVPDIVARNGHQDNRNIILKMDIEGAEWPVFESLEADDMARFSQIVVELHSFVTGGEEHLRRAIPLLEKINATHQSVHFHANNWSWLGILGGVAIPDVWELTYVRKSDHQFAPCSRSFPTDLDRPCRVGAPDYFLRS